MEKVFITGASSGIGEHLAYEYARRGAVLGLTARRKDRLEAIAEKCRDFAKQVFVYEADVTQKDDVKNCADFFIKDAGGIDVVIANAGIGGDDQIQTGDAETVNKILNINVLGVTNTIIPFVPKMREQKSGKLVIMSSLAGFKGLAYHGAYSASKAAVRTLGDSWRFSLRKYNVHVITICPGFIESEMTAKSKFAMPFLMETETAAKKMVRAIDQNKKIFIVPWPWKIIKSVMNWLPDWVFYSILK